MKKATVSILWVSYFPKKNYILHNEVKDESRLVANGVTSPKIKTAKFYKHGILKHDRIHWLYPVRNGLYDKVTYSKKRDNSLDVSKSSLPN